MNKAEIKQKIESSFKPYHCGVEFLPVMGAEVLEDGLGIQVSDKDDTLRYTAKATLKALRADFAWHIKIWRDGAKENGFKLDPL